MEKSSESETKVCSVSSDTSVEEKDDVKASNQNDSLHTSSVLLTPDASPVKDKDSVSESAQCSDDDTTKAPPCVGNRSPVDLGHTHANIEPKLNMSGSETTSAHCKQLQQSPERTSLAATAASPTFVPKKRKGKQGKAKTGTADKAGSQTRPKSGRRKKIEPDSQNKTITDYFPVRRSGRRTESLIKKEQTEELEKKILTHCEDGLEVVTFEEKGRGVMATRCFNKGEFVVEYAGELIDLEQAKQKEQAYSENPKIGCYMYYFIHKNKRYCVDATGESGKLGRLINHSRNGNCQPKVVEIKKLPYLILVASREIAEGEELLYDYGDRSQSSIESHPWLKL